MTQHDHPYLSGARIDPAPLSGRESLVELIDRTFAAYNAARLREAARLLVEKMSPDEVTVGLSLTGALTPAGLGKSCLVPLVEAGIVDWIATTGANLYHDAHYAIGLEMRRGSPHWDDVELRDQGVVRIYDLVFDYNVLLETDRFFRMVMRGEEFSGAMSSAEFHFLLGKYVAAIEERLDLHGNSLLAAAWRHAVPIFTPSPGDSSIGMNVAELQLEGSSLAIDVSRDVNLSAAIVWAAKEAGGRSAVWILGGGSPKNFMLQTEPQIQEVLGLSEAGHDYFLQITDARPDTGGLSGATPGEAVSWGKVDPDRLPDAVVVYSDTTIALPLLTHYVLASGCRRTPRRLLDRAQELLAGLEQAFAARRADREAEGGFESWKGAGT